MLSQGGALSSKRVQVHGTVYMCVCGGGGVKSAWHRSVSSGGVTSNWEEGGGLRE